LSGPGRSLADLHCHTSASFDSLAKPEQVARAAAERGLTHLAITDHDRIDGALRARDSAPDELSVIIGQEVRTTTGDLIALFVERPIAPGMAPYEAAQAIHEQGGVVGLAHPFDRFRAGAGRKGWEDELERVVPALDYVEVWNARPIDSAEQFRAALGVGPQLVTAHGSRLIRLTMPFIKVVQMARGNRRVSAA
jgi:hypothetical protein